MKSQILIATVLAIATGAVAAPVIAKSQPGADPRMPSFQSLDLDGDGALNQEELRAGGAARFDAIDSNGDGLLSADEMIAHAQQRLETRTAKMIERFDKNGDGELNLEEMPQRRGVITILDMADTNGNGTISKAEFDTAVAIAKTMSHRKKQRDGFHMGGGRGPVEQN